ncbi:MAG: hypothetical protein FWE88_04085 [Phycisphaerae bacterium]|nr:hypothetical protein [Phycisphaerae bacterium]
MKKDSIAIVVLCVSAAILVALVIGSYATTPAQAGSASVKGGDYILGTASMRDTVDMVTVIDVNAQRMIVYVPNKTGSPTQIDMGDSIDLRRSFERR